MGSTVNWELYHSTSFKSANVTETESNDVAGNADAFPLSGTIRGQISVDDDADFYKITVTDSGAITLGFTSYMEWYSLRVIDSDGENLWSDEDNQFDSTVGFRQDEYRLDLEEGIYYLRVDGTGEWSLALLQATTLFKPLSQVQMLLNLNQTTVHENQIRFL